MHIEHLLNEAAPSEEADPSAAPPAGDNPAGLSAYNLIEQLAGGRQKDLVALVGRDQSTVSKWKVRGVPIEAAPDIARAFERAGRALTMTELIDAIMSDRRRDGA